MRTFQAIGLALISFTITLAIFQPSAPALAQQQASSPTLQRELALEQRRERAPPSSAMFAARVTAFKAPTTRCRRTCSSN